MEITVSSIGFRVYPSALIEENKWRAVRHGLDGDLVDLGSLKIRPARELIEELIDDHIGDVLDELGTRKEVEYAYEIIKSGTSADRQLEAFADSSDLNAVVDKLSEETAKGL